LFSAWHELGLRSIILATIGRASASDDRIRTPCRRRMRRLLATLRSRRRCGCTQRWQSETVNSMMKRNLGDHLRARTPEGRRFEQMLRVITHNISLLLADENED
jgi:hypothetical protein